MIEISEEEIRQRRQETVGGLKTPVVVDGARVCDMEICAALFLRLERAEARIKELEAEIQKQSTSVKVFEKAMRQTAGAQAREDVQGIIETLRKDLEAERETNARLTAEIEAIKEGV